MYSVLFCLSTIALEAVAYIGLQSSIYPVVDRESEATLLGVDGFLERHAESLASPQDQRELRSHPSLRPEFLLIRESGGQTLWESATMAKLKIRTDQSFPKSTWTVNSPGEPPLRVSRTRHTVGGRQYDVYVATDLTVPFQVIRRFWLLALLSSPFILACSTAISYWVSGQALAPVSQMTKAARSIGTANLGDRLAVPASNDELQHLAETLNEMLARIEDGFRRVTQFTANASHELRSPLAVIQTTAEVALLCVPADPESYRESLYRILQVARRNTTLLEDMLQLARADSGSRVVRLTPVNLAENVQRACEDISPLAHERGIDLRKPAFDEPLWVRADSALLQRLWLILLDNAIKYTSGGGIVAVNLSGREDSVVCEVRDSGMGIAAADQPHIFERFYRSDAARNRENGGAGLGLSVAQWIVESHHGAIEVESVPATGSAFRVRLARLPVSRA